MWIVGFDSAHPWFGTLSGSKRMTLLCGQTSKFIDNTAVF